MAEAVEKLSGKLGINTTDFKAGILAANRELRVLETSFKAGAAALGDWTKDATGLESRMKSLTSQIDIQKLKVDALREEHQRLVEANGENSRAAQDAEIKLNKETETLNKMERELTTTSTALEEMQGDTDEAGDSVEDLGNNTDETGGKLEGFKSVLGGVGAAIKTTVGIALGLVAAVAAIGGAMAGMVFSVAGASADLVDLSAKTGITVEQLQEMAYIGDQVGTSLDTITGAQSRLIRSMNSGRDGTGEQADAFKALGIDVEDATGNLRNTQDVFDDVIDKLGEIENPAERDALAMSLFGKSAQELNPLIAAGSDELAKLAEEAHNVGAVMAEEDVAAFEAFDDTLASLQAGLKGTVGTLLTAFLPGFQLVFDQVGGYLEQFKAIVDVSDGDLGKVAEGLTGLISQIAEDIAQQAPQMLEAGLAIVNSILSAISQSAPVLFEGATKILKNLLEFLISNLPLLFELGFPLILMVVDTILQNLPFLIDAAIDVIIALGEGLSTAAPELIPAVVEAVLLIVQTLLENAPLLIDVAGLLLIAIADGIAASLPYLSGYVLEGKFFPTLINGLKKIIPSLLQTGYALLVSLAQGLVNAIPAETLRVVSMFIENMLTQFAFNIIGFVDMGRNFIDGMVQGLYEGAGALYEAITSIVEELLGTVTSALGIQSPSKVGKGYGRNFIGAMALGGLEVLQDVERTFTAMTGRLTEAAVSGFGTSQGSGPTTVQNHDSLQFFAPVYVQGNTPAGSLGSRLKSKRI